MNQREKEAYLREYSQLKAEGKPFYPYAVAKDSAMAVLVLVAIIFMSLILGAELGPKADPTSTRRRSRASTRSTCCCCPASSPRSSARTCGSS